jgi:hypothetical protein
MGIWLWDGEVGSTQRRATALSSPTAAVKGCVRSHLGGRKKRVSIRWLKEPKVSYDIVANRGKESAENLRVG